MDKPAAQALLAKLEAATEGMQYAVIYDALVFAHQEEWISDGPYDTAVQWCIRGAFESAALTLVPEGAWNGQIMWSFGELLKGGYVELNLARPEWLKDDWDPSEPPHDHLACVNSYDDLDVQAHPVYPRPIALAICIAAFKARLEAANGLA